MHPHLHGQSLFLPDDLIQFSVEFFSPLVGLSQLLVFSLQFRLLFVQLGDINGLDLGIAVSICVRDEVLRELPKGTVRETVDPCLPVHDLHIRLRLVQRVAQLRDVLQVHSHEDMAQAVHLQIAQHDDSVAPCKADGGGQVIKTLFDGGTTQFRFAVEQAHVRTPPSAIVKRQ